MDQRLIALTEWVQATVGGPKVVVRPASSDASFRRYFRVMNRETSMIVMDAPPEHEGLERFVRIADLFLGLGLNVPKVLAQDHANGYLLLTDLGSTLYLDALTSTNADRLYGDAFQALLVLQSATHKDPEVLPPYDQHLLRAEMELFRRWYLGTHLGIQLSERQNQWMDDIYQELIDSALAQPKVWVHRDYHSRNLTYNEQQDPGILDFQDAVIGPVTYDLASLLRDCYIDWPQAQLEAWALQYFELARRAGVPMGEDEKTFLRWFDLMGVQRHLKAIGIFARLYHRDGKSGYLKDIPRTLGYVNEVGSRYPDLEPLAALVDGLPPGNTAWT